jgi:hypothetical protein
MMGRGKAGKVNSSIKPDEWAPPIERYERMEAW